MTQPDKAALAECIHANLQFNSGDYYVSCIDCHAMWMRKSRGSQPEYGYDYQGRKIGAAPEEATGNQNAMMSGPRALRADDVLREALERIINLDTHISDGGKVHDHGSYAQIAMDALAAMEDKA